MTNFDRLNNETRRYREHCVDRFNPSTRANYQVTHYAPNGSMNYGYAPSSKTGKGHYDGRGQYVED